MDDADMNEPQIDDEGPDETDADLLGEDETPTTRCPSCQVEIDEDAERCPACGQYVLRATGIPSWVLVLAVLATLGLVIWLMR
jgi:hypothetical protein